MKKTNSLTIKKTLWSVLLGAAVLTGCSKGSEPGGEPSDGLIRLSAGLEATLQGEVKGTKAIGTGDVFTAAVGGWQSEGDADYSKTRTWLSTVVITASENAAGITLSPARYYSQNGAERTYMKGWYPQGTLGGDGKVTFSPGADYKGDGTDDVLLAGEVSGSALDAATRTLAFKHLCTQLKFTVKGDQLFVDGNPATINAITIKGTGVPTGIDLKTNNLLYNAAAGVTVPAINGTQNITTTATEAGAAVMIPPFAGSSFTIDVQTSDVTYRDVLVTIDADASTLPGKAYTIALSFNGYEINASASVAEWDNSGTGSGNVTDN